MLAIIFLGCGFFFGWVNALIGFAVISVALALLD